MPDEMPTNLRFSERNMWEAVSPTRAEVRILLGRISRLRAALDEQREKTAAAMDVDPLDPLGLFAASSSHEGTDDA